MQIKTILGAISLALTLNSVQAGGIYRYHDEDAYKAYRAQEAYNNVFYVRNDDLDNISSELEELEELEGATHDR